MVLHGLLYQVAHLGGGGAQTETADEGHGAQAPQEGRPEQVPQEGSSENFHINGALGGSPTPGRVYIRK
jgi:hypothetical protein